MTLSNDNKEKILADIVVDLDDREVGFRILPAIKVTMLQADGTYRTGTPDHRTEFLPESARLAKNGEEIFSFTPEDYASDYEAIELRASKIDEAMPMFLEEMVGLASDSLDFMGSEFAAQVESARSVPELMKLIWQAEAARQEKEAEVTSDALKSNPLYGMF